jgi:two-component system LytT family sensor kinase
MQLKRTPVKKTRRKFIFFFLLWWMVWGSLQSIAIRYAGVAPPHALGDALISNGLLAGFSLLILSNMKYYLPGKEKYLYMFIVSLALGGLWLLITNITERNIFKSDAVFLYILNSTMGLRFVFAFLMLACVTLAGLLWHTERKQAEDEFYKRETERIAKDAELNKLRQQLQPHFLFNSLNSISALTGTQPEKARHMIQQLSEFLRGTLKKEDTGPITIEEELQQLELYLEIEKLRFGYRLKTTIDSDPALMHMKIPSLLLQPIVENAIKFGLYDTIDEVEITVTVKAINMALQITVTNPFDEITSMPAKGTGFGLSSVRRRLFLLFGRQDLLQTKQDKGNFITIITIPQTT